jgi:hypothetical protein
MLFHVNALLLAISECHGIKVLSLPSPCSRRLACQIFIHLSRISHNVISLFLSALFFISSSSSHVHNNTLLSWEFWAFCHVSHSELNGYVANVCIMYQVFGSLLSILLPRVALNFSFALAASYAWRMESRMLKILVMICEICRGSGWSYWRNIKAPRDQPVRVPRSRALKAIHFAASTFPRVCVCR